MLTFPHHDDLQKAIPLRKSRRSYDTSRIVSRSVVDSLKEFAASFTPYEGIRIEISEARVDLPVFKGIFASFARANASLFATLIVDNNQSFSRVKAGIVLEAFVLYCTAQSLGTCIISGTWYKDNIKRYYDLAENEDVLAVTPIGYCTDTKPFGERVLSTMAGSAKRKPMSTLILSDERTMELPWMTAALEAARISPSAINRQSWRFVTKDNQVAFFFDGRETPNYPKTLDVGLCIANFLVALPFGKSYDVTFHDVEDSTEDIYLVCTVSFAE
ncbi:hypothetical protein GEMRC1_009223 [Eukaryota sp. GEM-RC1]